MDRPHFLVDKTPTVDEILKYENGSMDEAEMIEFFQRLVDSGLAWTLQGSYGRTANDLLRAGLINDPIRDEYMEG